MQGGGCTVEPAWLGTWTRHAKGAGAMWADAREAAPPGDSPTSKAGGGQRMARGFTCMPCRKAKQKCDGVYPCSR